MESGGTVAAGINKNRCMHYSEILPQNEIAGTGKPGTGLMRIIG